MTNLIRNNELEELVEEFNKQQYLSDHTEDIEIALSYFMEDYEADELDVNTFIEHYEETYINSAEVIYYHNAIDILKEEDPSLKESLELSKDMGYDLDNINSELLATILLQGLLKEELNNLRTEIEEYFESIQEELIEILNKD